MPSVIRSLLIVLTVLTVGCERVSTEEMLQRAAKSIDANDYRAAVIDLRSVLREEPNNARARWMLGEAYLAVENGPAAESALRRAGDLGVGDEAVLPMLAQALLMQARVDEVLDLQPGTDFSSNAAGELRALRAMAAIHKGDLSLAESEFAQAIALTPTSPYVRYVQAEILVAKGKDGEAEQLLLQLTELHPEKPRAWSLLGRLTARRGDFVAAEDAYSKAIALRASPITDTIHRGFARLSQKKIDDAERDAQTALKAAPREARAHLLLGSTRLERGDAAGAKEALDQAVNLKPSNLGAVTALAVAEKALGNQNRAIYLAEQALAKAPKSVVARKLLADYALINGQGEKAEEYIRPVASNSPDDLQAQLIFARSLLMQGKADDAAPIAAELADRLPTSVGAQTWAGIALMAAEKDEAGIAALARAAELVPENKQVNSLLIMGLMDSDSTAAAVAAAQRYAEMRSDSLEARNLLAMTYLAVGKKESGKAELRQVLSRDKGNLTAARTLASLLSREGDPVAARRVLDQAIKTSPGDVGLLELRADLALREGEPEIAERLLRRALNSKPEDTGLRIKVVQQLLARGDLRGADRMMQGVETRADRAALAAKAEIAVRSGRLANARPILEELAVLMPDNVRIHYWLAKVYAATEDRFRLEKTIDRLAVLVPGDGRVRLARAKLLAANGELAAAAAEVNASGLPDSDSDVLATRLALASAAGSNARAIEIGRKLLEVEPNARNAVLLGKALLAGGNSAGAIQSLDRWVESNPTDILVLIERAKLARESGNREAYLADLRQILQLESDNIFALNNLAWELRQSKPGEALRYAQMASERAPDSSQVLDTLAKVYAEAGDFPNALRMIDRAVDLAADSYLYRLHRAEIRYASGDATAALEDTRALLREPLPADIKSRAQELKKLLDG